MLVDPRQFTFAQHSPFILESGQNLSPVTIVYETYGSLNQTGDNAILILHGFTADSHAAGCHDRPNSTGWWDDMIGPGKAFDTNFYYVISSNVIGGCAGSTGPSSNNPATGKPFGGDFPRITINDMVRAQYHLVCDLGVTSLAAVTGASMGGQQALEWIRSYPTFVRAAIPIACSSRLSALGLALSEVSRKAITDDPAWRSGHYYDSGQPEKGLALARMAAHLSYISEQFLEIEFGRRQSSRDTTSFSAGPFDVQDYLRAEGASFVKRFDANSFLCLSNAIDQFDFTAKQSGVAANLEGISARVLLLSFRTDWLFSVPQVRELGVLLSNANVQVDHITVETTFGHDAFLTDWRKISPLIREFIGTLN